MASELSKGTSPMPPLLGHGGLRTMYLAFHLQEEVGANQSEEWEELVVNS